MTVLLTTVHQKKLRNVFKSAFHTCFTHRVHLACGDESPLPVGCLTGMHEGLNPPVQTNQTLMSVSSGLYISVALFAQSSTSARALQWLGECSSKKNHGLKKKHH